jgi:hypothetical protein
MTALPNEIECLALLGWRLYPTSGRSKAACIKDPGASATFDLDKLEFWSREFPGCNWRMVCEGSGVWALDVDVPSEDHAADGVAALANLVKRHGPIPSRPMTRSGGGGLALFFRHRGEPIHGATGWPVPGIDPRRGRLSVTVPPSIHVRTRRPYTWAVAPWQVSPPDAPGWLLKAVAPPPPLSTAMRSVSDGPHNADPMRRNRYAEAALRNAISRVASAPQGQRNDMLNKQMFRLMRFARAGDLAVREIAESMAVAARQAGLAAPEVQATLRSALRSIGIR